MYCAKCGAELVNGAVNCSSCGQQVGSSVSITARKSGWKKSTRKRVWWAIGILWSCGFLFFNVLYVPMTAHDTLYDGFETGNAHRIVDETRLIRAPIFRHNMSDKFHGWGDTDYYVIWTKWRHELLYTTLPALVLLGLTFVLPVSTGERKARLSPNARGNEPITDDLRWFLRALTGRQLFPSAG